MLRRGPSDAGLVCDVQRRIELFPFTCRHTHQQVEINVLPPHAAAQFDPCRLPGAGIKPSLDITAMRPEELHHHHTNFLVARAPRIRRPPDHPVKNHTQVPRNAGLLRPVHLVVISPGPAGFIPNTRFRR